MKFESRLNTAIQQTDGAGRIRLEVGAWKTCSAADPELYRKRSREQLGETKKRLTIFGNLASQIMYVDALLERVRCLEQRCYDLESLDENRRFLTAIKSWFFLVATEPITPTEYRQREADARSTLVPLAELPTELVDLVRSSCIVSDGFAKDPVTSVVDLEPGAFTSGIIEQVTEGALTGEENEHGPSITLGAFYDYLGLPVPVNSEYGGGFVVRPEATSEEVAQERRVLRSMRELFSLLPDDQSFGLEPPHPECDVEVDDTVLDGDPVMERHAAALRKDVQDLHEELASFRVAVCNVAATYFLGNDPLLPSMAQQLEDGACRLAGMAERLKPFGGLLELGTADMDRIGDARAIILRSVPAQKPTTKGAKKK